MSATKPRSQLPDTGHHDRRLAKHLADDPEFRTEFERQQHAVAAIDQIVGQLDELRAEHDYTKARLARMIDKHPASVRRLLTAAGNPELATIVAMADALDTDVVVVPRRRGTQARRDSRDVAA